MRAETIGLAVKGYGLCGLAVTGAALAFPGPWPLATAAGVSAVAGIIGLATLGGSRKATPYPLDRPPHRGVRPSPGDGALLLGSGPEGEVWTSLRRIVYGLRVCGPDAARCAFLAGLSRQAADAGIAHAVISCSPSDATVAAVLSDRAGSPWTLTVLDAEAGFHSTHSIAPLAGLEPRSVIRVILAGNPALRGDAPAPVTARALLRAMVPALHSLYSEGLLDMLTVDALVDHLDIKKVIDFTDRDAYPAFGAEERMPVTAYLSSLPGFQEEKKYKQSSQTLEFHAAAASLVADGLRWAQGRDAPCSVSGVPDAMPLDLAAPGHRTVIRAGHAPGEEHALRTLVACLSEAVRARPRGPAGQPPFLVIASGFDSCPPDVAGMVRALAGYGVAIACDGHAPAPVSDGAHVPGLVLTLPGEGSDTPARLVGDGVGMDVLEFPDAPEPKARPLRRRIPVTRPDRDAISTGNKLVSVLNHLLGDDLVEDLRARSAEARDGVYRKSLRGDPLAIVAHRMSAVAGEDPKVSACAALASVPEERGYRSPTVPREGRSPDPDPPPHRPRASDTPVEPDPFADLEFASFDPPPSRPQADRAPSTRPAAPQFPDVPARTPPQLVRHGPSTVVVPDSVAGDTQLSEARWKSFAGKPMPLASVDDHAAAKETLVSEFPHLADIVGRIVNDAARGGHVRLRPILFHGPAGSGKSRFARRLGEVLGLRTLTYNCGGVADSSFGGTSRQWSSARASIPLQHVARTGMANPAILLDELEKVGAGRQNGNLADLMLGLTERETACRSFDPLLEVEVDLSHVTWLATANSLASLHPAFRDRFRAVKVPCPGLEHAGALIPPIVAAVNEERGLAGDWAFVPNEGETDMIAELWGGGSVRRLRRVVERVMDAVDGMDKGMLH